MYFSKKRFQFLLKKLSKYHMKLFELLKNLIQSNELSKFHNLLQYRLNESYQLSKKLFVMFILIDQFQFQRLKKLSNLIQFINKKFWTINHLKCIDLNTAVQNIVQQMKSIFGFFEWINCYENKITKTLF